MPLGGPFSSFATTDTGSMRENNEDEVFSDDQRGIYFVIDGMGGHAAGEEAARIAKERLLGRLGRAIGSPEERIREAIALANSAILDAATENSAWNGMACVLTVALIDSGGSVTIGHVGDSRLYKLSGGPMKRVTKDHSPVGELVDSQALTEDQAMSHPRRNEVYRDVGSAPHGPDDEGFIEIFTENLEPHAALLLCSDGLTDALRESEIERVVSGGAGNLPVIAGQLIAQASAQGTDNISVVLVAGPSFGSQGSPASATGQSLAQKRSAEIGARNILDTGACPPAAVESLSRLPNARRTLRRLWPPLLWMLIGALVGEGLRYAPEAINLLFGPLRRTAPGDARDINVLPGQSVMAAISRAKPGDTVRLTKSEYRESIRIDKHLTLDGADATLVSPSPVGFIGVTVNHTQATISNLHIFGSNGARLRIGLKILDSEVVVRNVDVVAADEAGLDAVGDSNVTVDGGSRFQDGTGPGIIIGDMAIGHILSSYISGNGHGRNRESPGIEIRSPNPYEIRGNTLVGNYGGAIWVPVEPPSDLGRQNTIVGDAEGRHAAKIVVKSEDRQ